MAKLFGVHINLNQNEIQNVLIHKLASAPSTPVAGQMYYNTGGNEMYFYDGTAWRPWKANGVISVAINATANGLSVNASTGAVTFTLALANGSSPGAMSSTHFNDLTNATAANTVSQIVKRDINGNISIADPVNASHAATKNYVDNVAQGLTVKTAVKAATTANITLSGTQTIDGISCVANDRVLVKNQTTASQNGVYIVASGSWTRATDYAVGYNAASTFMFIQQGTTLAETGWVCTSDSGTAVVGTNNLNYTQFTGAGSGVTAGTGIDVTGNVVSINSLVARKYVASGITIGGGTATTITHNLNTYATIAEVRDASTTEIYECDIVNPTVNTLTVTALGATRTVYVVVFG